MIKQKTIYTNIFLTLVILLFGQFSSTLDISLNKNILDFNINDLLYTGKEKDESTK